MPIKWFVKWRSYLKYQILIEMNTALSYLAEYLGSFFFILTIFASRGNPFVIGGALAIIVYLDSAQSGAHVNPAVSVAMHLNGSLSSHKLAYYIIFQVLGGVSAYYAYQMVR
jgi:glycerol uptake facilitator-like aquaporin